MFLQGNLVDVLGKNSKKKRNLQEMFFTLMANLISLAYWSRNVHFSLPWFLHAPSMDAFFIHNLARLVSLPILITMILCGCFLVSGLLSSLFMLATLNLRNLKSHMEKRSLSVSTWLFSFQVSTLVPSSKLVNTSYRLMVKAWIAIPGAVVA